MNVEQINARIREIKAQDLLLAEVNIKLRQLQSDILKHKEAIAAHNLRVDAEYQDILDVEKRNKRFKLLGGLDDRIMIKEQEEYRLAALKLKNLHTELEAAHYQEGLLLNKKEALENAVSELPSLVAKKIFIIKSTAIVRDIHYIEKQETLIKLEEIELKSLKESQVRLRQGHQKIKTLQTLISDLNPRSERLYSTKLIKAQQKKIAEIDILFLELKKDFDVLLYSKQEKIKKLPFPTQLFINIRSFISNMKSGMIRKNQFESFMSQLKSDLSNLESLKARVDNLVRVANKGYNQLQNDLHQWVVAY